MCKQFKDFGQLETHSLEVYHQVFLEFSPLIFSVSLYTYYNIWMIFSMIKKYKIKKHWTKLCGNLVQNIIAHFRNNCSQTFLCLTPSKAGLDFFAR